MTRPKWMLTAVVALVAWVGTVVLAVAMAGDDGTDDAAERPAAPDDYTVDLGQCLQPEGAEDGGVPPAPTRRAEGTFTNETDERRSFRLQVAFETPDSVRIDWAPAVIDQLGPGETARWEAASYLELAGEDDVVCQVAAVDVLSEAAGTLAGASGQPLLPSVVFSTTDNVDGAGTASTGSGGADGGGTAGDVGDIDAVSYVCYVVNPRVPVTCGTVSN